MGTPKRGSVTAHNLRVTPVPHMVSSDRLVIPFQIACDSCYMCDQQLYTQCEDGALKIVLKP